VNLQKEAKNDQKKKFFFPSKKQALFFQKQALSKKVRKT